MTDQSINSPNAASRFDSGDRLSPEIGPSGPADSAYRRYYRKHGDLGQECDTLGAASAITGRELGILVAAMLISEWGGEYYRVWTLLVAVSATPFLLIAERFWAKKKSWLLKPDEMAEDLFWMASGGLLWGPIVSDMYRTPVSDGFLALRDMSPLQIEFQPTTVLGLIGAMLVIRFTSSFFYYWLHRIQHESLFWWRMHATHHHLTKLSAMRGNRTHPLEYLALGLGTPMALALMGATTKCSSCRQPSGMWNGKFNHANLPMVSMPVWDWFLCRTAASLPPCTGAPPSRLELRMRHHFLDRVFGTYCGDAEVGPAGAGKGVRLSIKDQLMLAFFILTNA